MPHENLLSCARCQQRKPASAFNRSRQAKTGRSSYCRSCARDYRRELRERDPERIRASGAKWQRGNREKVAAHRKLLRAVQNGTVVKPDRCEGCGRSGLKLHGHHNDYAKPLEVKWLCPPCHKAAHDALAA